ncbi:helix-turn-helix domain-containing protein [Actinomycetospora lutea]|uniref:helix-turn-helix domain-containing protein n=1 Tax=Actinomycetospora lutea TaxID=663604 RepID=UPI0023666AF2|nr:helix-turn-helix domain-containing protein [Actinomycetospora lutea]MDD7939814.1 helix-turn-helix domain-containing protein [Actinomycetospora lutea]
MNVRPRAPTAETVVSEALRSWSGAISELARAVKAAEPLEVLLGRVAEHACRLIGFDFGAVMLADPSRERLMVRGAFGLSDAYVERLNTDVPLRVHAPVPGVDAPAARAVREGVTVTAADIAGLPDFDRLRRLAQDEGYHALLAAPLLTAEEPMGVLVAYSARARDFSAAEVELAELLAEHAAVAVETARLRESEQRAIDELSRANDALRRHQDVVDRAERQHRRLLELALDDVGLPRLVSWLAATVGASVTVEDVDRTVLAHAGADGYVPPPASAPPQELRRPSSVRERYELVELRPSTTVDGSATAWETPIVLGGEVAGRLWLTGAPSAPEAVERRTVERFALVAAFELLKERHGIEVEARLSQAVLTELLRQDGDDVPAGLAGRAAALGCDLAAPHTVVVLDVGTPPREDRYDTLARVARLAESVVAQERDRAGRTLVGIHDGALVLLVPAGWIDRERLRRLLARLEQVTAPQPVSAVIAGTGTSPAAHAASCRAARNALALMRRPDEGRILDLADLGVHGLVLEAGVASGLSAFARRLLDPLERHDRRHGAALVTTLRVWLREDCSAPATAAALVVHRNTVAHRLRRIEALLGHPLRSPSVLLQLQLAVVVRDVEEVGVDP